ncbi:MAG TPA: cyclic nucleotide-binding domain-containing protein [Polyangiaceae bacterium]|nr:cyclic nucleotide-binding domain-containing protein [Polyangiaceae bacterium]
MIGILLEILPLLLGVIVVAALLRFVPGAPRARLRRSVLLFLLYAGVLLASEALRWAHAGALTNGFAIAASLLRVLLAINLGAIVLFDLLVRLVHWDYPDILHDLTVGAAYLVAIGWLMHRVGFNVTGIVATSAVVTAVVGLSLQATLGNVVGGLALQVDDSIREGDWIELENKTQGQIRKIRWRHTVIETRDWDTLLVPNGQLMSQTIKLLGKRDGHGVPHRMTVLFGVDYRFSLNEVIRIVEEALRGAPIHNVLPEPQPNCVCLDLARDQHESYAIYGVRYWISDLTTDDGTNSAVRARLYTALRRAQIPLAMPAAALFLSHDEPERIERKRKKEIEFKRSALDAVDLFARLSLEEKTALAESAKLTPFARGEIITRQGTTAHWLYVLTRGKAEVRVRAGGDEDRLVAVLEAPSFFGEMALMTGQPREATVVALGELECLRVDKSDFEDILKRRPEIAQEISGILAQRRVELEAVREGLDAEARRSRIVSERGRILTAIKGFFGLESSN